ncbi:MAG: hypothetical protein AW08_03311 [Candidatus Accumulibacter adjunctus]|uniref:Uncharacterized protein n=1 Tax=Candidatus Accumulibacter adjunctus TaxID=1454001 RepID=A0A011M6L7_9PROT|nr:MAG: hypothetical protein AW08_03311 [Candidatus Accumulibacter adjunctus]
MWLHLGRPALCHCRRARLRHAVLRRIRPGRNQQRQRPESGHRADENGPLWTQRLRQHGGGDAGRRPPGDDQHLRERTAAHRWQRAVPRARRKHRTRRRPDSLRRQRLCNHLPQLRAPDRQRSRELHRHSLLCLGGSPRRLAARSSRQLRWQRGERSGYARRLRPANPADLRAVVPKLCRQLADHAGRVTLRLRPRRNDQQLWRPRLPTAEDQPRRPAA